MIFDSKIYTGLQIFGSRPMVCSLHKAAAACTEGCTPKEEEATN